MKPLLARGGYYLLTYHDKGSDTSNTQEGHEDDILYVFVANSSAISGNELSCEALKYEEFLQGQLKINGEIINFSAPEYDSNGNLIGLTLTSDKRNYHGYSSRFNSKKTISNPDVSIGALGVQSDYSGNYFDYNFDSPKVTVSVSDEKTNCSMGTKGSALAFNWTFTPQNGKFAIYQTFDFTIRATLSGTYHTYGYAELSFNTASKKINFNAASQRDEAPSFTPSNYHFTIFQINSNTIGSDGRITQLGTGNKELTPMNYVATGTTTSFDASKYVLEQQFNANGTPILDANGHPTYALAPIRSYNLNNGKGTYLEQLNHVVKLFRATEHNFQMTISNSFLGGLFGDNLDTNSGGIVGTQIGVSDPPVYASIPTGMIAFNITTASKDEPSYINIIVAVNPGQMDVSKIGLWYMKDDSSWSSSFDINSPNQSFTLPISKVASASTDSKYIYTISQSKHYNMQGGSIVVDEKGNPTYVDSVEAAYTYLGGQTVLVYHSFQVTEAGTYLLGSAKGPMSVAYFSVSGAAGTGADGSSASPLGNVDFVYANNGKIVTVNQKFTGLQDVNNEDYAFYYPSYHFVLMVPKDEASGTITKIQNETIRIYRYIDPGDSNGGTKRHIKIIGCTNAEAKGLADMYEDDLE